VQRRIQGTLFDNDPFAGNSADMHNDAVSVHRAQLGEGFQDEKIQRTLEIVFGHRRFSFAIPR